MEDNGGIEAKEPSKMERDSRSINNEEYRLAGYNSLDQLQVLYEIRVRENQQLNAVLLELQAKVASQECMLVQMTNICDEYDARHAMSKNEIVNLELDAKSTKTQFEALETSNSDLSMELTLYKTLAADLQSQLLLVQGRNGPDNFADAIVQSVRQQHQREVLSLQQQLHTQSDTIVQKNSDIERYQRTVKAYEMEMNEKLVSLGLKETSKSTIANLQQKLTEMKDKLNGLTLECEAKGKDMAVLQSQLQETELELYELKSRDVMFTKLTLAFIQDLKQLSLNILGAAPKEDFSQVAELKRLNLVSYKQLLSRIQMTSETEDPDLQIKVLRKMIHREREQKTAALDECSAVKEKLAMLASQKT